MSDRKVLHVGCGVTSREKIPLFFDKALGHYQEIRLDINPRVKPDIIGDIRTLEGVENESVDGLFSSHNIEHLYYHEVPQALSNFHRVMKDEGILCIRCPDAQAVGEKIATGDLEEKLYEINGGVITPLDILYGFAGCMEEGNLFMMHKTAFSAKTLARKIYLAGFRYINIHRAFGYELIAVARKTSINSDNGKVLEVINSSKSGNSLLLKVDDFPIPAIT